MDSITLGLQREVAILRERVRQFEDALIPPSIVIPLEYSFTQREACVFAHLATRDVATKSSIMMALYSDRPDEEPGEKIVDVFVCKMRKKLAPFGVRINTIWGQGYSLENRSDFVPRGLE